MDGFDQVSLAATLYLSASTKIVQGRLDAASKQQTPAPLVTLPAEASTTDPAAVLLAAVAASEEDEEGGEEGESETKESAEGEAEGEEDEEAKVQAKDAREKAAQDAQTQLFVLQKAFFKSVGLFPYPTPPFDVICVW